MTKKQRMTMQAAKNRVMKRAGDPLKGMSVAKQQDHLQSALSIGKYKRFVGPVFKAQTMAEFEAMEVMKNESGMER